MRQDILPIGDMHLETSKDLDRIHLLGRFIVKKKPRKVIQVGDWLTWLSLLPHGSKGGLQIEGSRYIKEVDLGNQSLDILDGYISKAEKSAGYKIDRVFLEGNHEYWITRAVENNPQLEGKLSLGDMKFKEYGWKVVPFLDPYKACGFTMKHYFTTGLMGRPIGGESPAVSLLRKNHMSCIAGHSHEFHAHETIDGSGKKMLSLVVGCYIDPKFYPRFTYTKETSRWWSGLVMLYEAEKGYASYAKYDFDYLRRNY